MSTLLNLDQPSIAKPAINAEILRFIEQTRRELGLAAHQMRILDWGCGRGSYVAYLRQAGYQAYGVDIADGAIAEARQQLDAMGCDAQTVIRKISAANQTDFQDESFHIVFSFQVLEHVADLASLLAEVRRVSMPGAVGIHIFPAKWRPLEVHLRMPFVHWFGKGAVRHMLIRAFLISGAQPAWREPLPTSVKDRASVLFRYSCENTYYRHLPDILRLFDSWGLHAKTDVLSHPKVQALRWLPKRSLEWLIVTFWSVQLISRRESERV